MAITFDKHTRVFSLQTQNTTWQMQVSEYGHLLHLYYGRKISDTSLTYLIRGINRGFSGPPYEARNDRGYSLDTYPQEYSAFGAGDYRESCLHAEYEDGSQTTELRYLSHRIYLGKYRLPGLPSARVDQGDGVQTLEIHLKDTASQVKVILYYGVLEQADIITRACQICNGGGTIYLRKALSACLDIQRDDLDVITFYGRHAMERNMQRSRTVHGKLVVDSVRGTSSHQQNPFVILCDRKAGEEFGECFGASFLYSGNFIAVTEIDQINQTRFAMGIHPEGFQWKLKKGEVFTAPEVVFSFSSQGLGRLSRNYHDFFRNHLIPKRYRGQDRPVLLNNWEATEFDFTEEELLSLAASAGELGIQLFVMDDGWFGARNHDKSGLGDWQVNRKKLPSGLSGFSEKIHNMGLLFGLWIEPEMVNEDSDLFRSHPDWALQVPGRQPNLERYQLVLDLSRDEVVEYLYDSICHVLDEAKPEYVKWDMNRNLSDVWSAGLPADRQGEVYHRYVLGVYRLMDRLTGRYPDILWEGCSGGGGRFDGGILFYMPQIWCSDDTDAAERIQIQYGTSFGYPVSSMGAHVSVCPNMQTGRSVPLETRAEVAMAGTFGYELDVRRLSKEERQQVKRQIADFVKYQKLIHYGDYYRLTDVEETPDYAAWEFADKNGSEALICAVLRRARANPPFLRIRVKGLKEERRYRINGEPKVYQGSALMYAGIPLPVMYGDYSSVRFYIQAV